MRPRTTAFMVTLALGILAAPLAVEESDAAEVRNSPA